MKKPPLPQRIAQTTELLILADGSIFAHNLTPVIARLLTELNPHDRALLQRSNSTSDSMPLSEDGQPNLIYPS